MENFLLPSKVEFEPGKEKNVGSMVVTPCYHGYGTTLGNALRRVLLSSLPGSAVEHFKIKGIQHEFSTVEGVKEDAVEIMLNLKQMAVKVFTDEPVTLNLAKKGVGPVTAGDIEANSNVEVVNKNLVICHLTKDRNFEMEITVGRGRGYKPVEEKNRKNYDLGTMVVDSVYTPVKDVGYHVEYTRVGDITNFEKLTLTVETNGTITPQEAIEQSTRILMDHFTLILDSASGRAAPAEETPEGAGEEETPAEAAAEANEEPVKKTRKSKKKEE